MYVDGGSSSKIMYEHCFNRFRSEVRSQMVPATTPLVGFSEEIIWSLGKISLLIKIGDEEHSTSAWMNFMIVRSPSPYNGIIGRPGVRRIQAIPSTAHRMLKFPVAGETVTLRSSRIIPLECTTVLGPGMLRRTIDQLAEEKIQVAIHPEYPEQTVEIGSTLIEKGRKELCIPIRQKKRGQAPERNKAIYEEVEMLVDADIMKEVHYHSWLSNPVMKCTKKSDFQWTTKVEIAFKQMKKLIAKLPMLTAPKEKEELIMYLAAAKEAVSAILMTEKDRKQMPIYFVSRALHGPKVNYTLMEKLILALMLSNLEVTGRLLKRRFELDEHDIHYRPKTLVKGQILEDFIVERPEDDHLDTLMDDKKELSDPWILFTDRSSCMDGSRGGLIITNPEGIEFTYALSQENGSKTLQANVDSKLVANQVNGVYVAKEPGMIKYLDKRNSRKKSIDVNEVLTIVEEEGRTWMTPIYEYLTKEILPEEKRKAGAIRCKANYVLREIHEGSCSMHSDPRSVVENALSNEETPFSLTYGVEAVISVEIGMPTLRTAKVDMIKNDEALGVNLDLLEEKREQEAIQEAKSKAKMEKYYNARVRNTSFLLGDLVYRNNEVSRAKDRGKLRPKWEGPYEVTKALGKGAYKLRDHNGNTLP
nr:reverse transcriptase domain-containing protein [Tanacetum cinerariifolium]